MTFRASIMLVSSGWKVCAQRNTPWDIGPEGYLQVWKLLGHSWKDTLRLPPQDQQQAQENVPSPLLRLGPEALLAALHCVLEFSSSSTVARADRKTEGKVRIA